MPQLTTTIAALAGAPLLLAAGTGSWTTHTVREGDTLWDLATAHRTDVRTLARKNQLPDGGRLIRVGAPLKVPGSVRSARRTLPARASTARYVVRVGDTVGAIAIRLKVPAATLLRLNHLDAQATIYVGQHLSVPGTAARTAAKSRTAAAQAVHHAHTVYRAYTVRPGDTVSAIAARAQASQAAVLKANKLTAGSLIRPGQRLRVPRQRAAAAPATSTFAGRTYPDTVVRAASANRHRLASRAVPGPAATRRLIERTARRYGVDPALAVAVA